MMVRVPVTAAKCVFGESNGDQIPVFEERAQEELTAREVGVVARERQVEASEERLRRWAERLRLMKGGLEVRDQRIQFSSKLVPRPTGPSVKAGRNERCPCGSGLKYKHCHGLSSRLPGSA